MGPAFACAKGKIPAYFLFRLPISSAIQLARQRPWAAFRYRPQATATLADRKVRNMKLVMAIIKPFKLDEVRDALNAVGVHGMTVSEVKGYGRQKGHTEIYRGAEYVVNFLPKLKVEVAVEDQVADKAISAIGNAAKTGQIGDGKIFVTDLGRAVRIRTGETDNDAL
jgi:nitrogen regulatory protein P-II 2